MKRRYRLLLLALIIAALAAIYFTNKSFVTGLLMLFQQNSTQVIMGRINKAESPAMAAVLLSAFQATVMPWKDTPRVVIASAAIFGLVPGVLLCLLGRLIAVLLWGFIGWLLVGIRPKRDRGLSLLYGGISCFLVPYAAPMALLWGAMGQKLWKLLLAALPVHLMQLGFYGKYASVYSSIIPDWCGYALYALAVLMIAAALFVRKKSHKVAGD